MSHTSSDDPDVFEEQYDPAVNTTNIQQLLHTSEYQSVFGSEAELRESIR